MIYPSPIATYNDQLIANLYEAQKERVGLLRELGELQRKLDAAEARIAELEGR